MNEIMSKLRLEECERRILFMPSEARLEIFLKKYEKKGPKIHCLAIKRFFFTKKCQEVHKR